MKKIDKIDGCYHCPLMLHRWSDVWYCTHNGDTRPIDYTKIKEIPIWCPLPDDTSQSAKPEQPSHSCTPCLADAHKSKHSGANDGEVLTECDPEGMKPKSKYEKAEAVRKYVLGENYRELPIEGE